MSEFCAHPEQADVHLSSNVIAQCSNADHDNCDCSVWQQYARHIDWHEDISSVMQNLNGLGCNCDWLANNVSVNNNALAGNQQV